MTASKIEIKDERSRLKKFFNGADPLIDGSNFFTGEYESTGGVIGINTDEDRDWTLFWRNTLHQEPPGPLPKGAMAIMMAQHRAGDPVDLVPESIVRGDKETTIAWQRVHTAKPGEPEPKSSFAVLLIRNSPDSQTYRDVFVAEDQRKVAESLAEELKAFTEGSRERITVLPITKLKRKMEFSRLG